MTHPHIEFATSIFSQPEYAEWKFRYLLPPDLCEQIDWSTLKLEPDAVADPELQECEGDLLFSVSMRDGEVLLLRLMFKGERTSADWDFEDRLVRHAVRQLQHWNEQHPPAERSMALFPVVLYFGREPWPAPHRSRRRPSLLN
jgi:hypothetical protein